jgi:small GTP-binding protein
MKSAFNTSGEDLVCSFKLVILGNSEVGKSSILRRFVYNSYLTNPVKTRGLDTCTKNTEVDGKKVSLQIWDTAGEEAYRAINNIYLRQAAACIVVYDLTNDTSYNDLDYWLEEINAAIDDPIVAIAGNKKDLEKERVVTLQTARRYCEDKGVIFRETSAKDNIGVTELFEDVCRSVISKMYGNQKPNITSFHLNEHANEGEQPAKRCCF